MITGIIFAGIIFVIRAWNECVAAITFHNNKNRLTLPIGMQNDVAGFSTNSPGQMATTLLMSVPVVMLFLVLQKYCVKALTEIAVKRQCTGQVPDGARRPTDCDEGSRLGPCRLGWQVCRPCRPIGLRQGHNAESDRGISIATDNISIGNRLAKDLHPKDCDVAILFQKTAHYPAKKTKFKILSFADADRKERGHFRQYE